MKRSPALDRSPELWLPIDRQSTQSLSYESTGFASIVKRRYAPPKSLQEQFCLIKIPAILLTVLGWGLPQPALAHGAKIIYQTTPAVVIQATYDDGSPMANAQTIIYAPQDPEKPWLTGVTDESGQFTFVPDRQQLGNWDVKVRQSGHGNIVSIPLKSETALTEDASPLLGGYSWGQKWLMAIAVSWGFVGTALYFSRK